MGGLAGWLLLLIATHPKRCHPRRAREGHAIRDPRECSVRTFFPKPRPPPQVAFKGGSRLSRWPLTRLGWDDSLGRGRVVTNSDPCNLCSVFRRGASMKIQSVVVLWLAIAAAPAPAESHLKKNAARYIEEPRGAWAHAPPLGAAAEAHRIPGAD